MSNENRILKKYDIFLASTLLLLSAAQIIVMLFKLSISLAIYNFIVTIISSLFILATAKIKIKKEDLMPIFLIILCRIINLIANINEYSQLEILTNLVYDACITINILMIYGVISTNPNFKVKYVFKYVYEIILIIGIVFCIYNLLNNANQIIYFNSIKYRYLINFSSFFTNRNNFGQLLFFLIITTFSVKKSKRIIIIRAFFIFNLLLTLSRTAIVSVCIFLIIYYLLLTDRKKYIKVLIVLMAIIIFLLTNPFNVINKMNVFLVRSDDALSGRTKIWDVALELCKKNPILGYGEVKSDKILYSYEKTIYVHNMYIENLLVGGVLTLFSMIWLIINVIKKDIYIYKKDNKKGAFCIATIITMLFYGITEEIGFFYFGLINILITFYGFIYPIILYNQLKRENENV